MDGFWTNSYLIMDTCSHDPSVACLTDSLHPVTHHISFFEESIIYFGMYVCMFSLEIQMYVYSTF